VRDGTLVRRETVTVTVSGARTELSELAGRPAADVLLLNDGDHTYAKIRLDPASMAAVVEHFAGFDNSLARGLAWTAAWDMVRDAELAARDYVTLVCGGLPTETDINLITSTLRQARGALTFYVDAAWAPTGWARLRDTAREALAAAKPGSGFQLAWANAYLSAIHGGADLDTVAGWLDGHDVPPGLPIDTDMRWSILETLVAGGRAGEAEIARALEADRTSGGERRATTAGVLAPTAAAKAEAWRRLTGPEALPNWVQRALLGGFEHPAQVELTAPYAAKYFEVLDTFWASRDSEQAQEFVEGAYPNLQISAETVAASEAFLADTSRPWPLRRLVAEGRDSVVRALAARARDRAAAG
jgi:aminopeptidase N